MPFPRSSRSFQDFSRIAFLSNSFWIDAERMDRTGAWMDRNGTEIRGVQVEHGTEESCLVSEFRKWHPESCANRHQVICVTGPKSCGTPSYPASSAIRIRTRLPADHFLRFGCEAGLRADLNTIECFENGTLSKEPSCMAEPETHSDFFGKVRKTPKLPTVDRLVRNPSASYVRRTHNPFELRNYKLLGIFRILSDSKVHPFLLDVRPTLGSGHQCHHGCFERHLSSVFRCTLHLLLSRGETTKREQSE